MHRCLSPLAALHRLLPTTDGLVTCSETKSERSARDPSSESTSRPMRVTRLSVNTGIHYEQSATYSVLDL